MNLAKVGSRLFLGSLFGIVVVWAFFPSFAIDGISYLVLLGLSVVGLILWFVFSLDRLKLWIKQRSTQFGLSLVMMALASFLILGFINWIAVKKNIKKDLTANQLHTLSDQTIKILGGLEGEVLMRVYSTNVTRMSPNLNVRDVLENYKIAANGKLKLEIFNPNEFSAEAEADNIKRDNIIVIKAVKSGRESRVENFSDNKGEEQITNAIIQAIKGQKKTLCFVSGHGQSSISDSGPQGLKTLKESLEGSNYLVKETVLVSVEKIPGECELLVNVGPKNAPLERELKMIEVFAEKGGAMLNLFGPRTPSEWKQSLKEFGVELRNDLLVDPYSRQNPVVIGTRNYANDVDVTESFGITTLFPETTSIRVPVETKSGLTVKTFVSSEARTYAKSGDIKSIRDITPSGTDIKGPLPIAILIERNMKPAAETSPEKPTVEDGGEDNQSSFNFNFDLFPSAYAQDSHDGHDHGGHDHSGHNHMDHIGQTHEEYEAKKAAVTVARQIVFSNDLFVVNGVVKNAGNIDLFSNSVNYLLQDQELIGIRPKDIRQTYLQITVQDIRKVWGFVLIVAGLFIVFGVKAARRKSIVA